MGTVHYRHIFFCVADFQRGRSYTSTAWGSRQGTAQKVGLGGSDRIVFICSGTRRYLNHVVFLGSVYAFG